MTTDKKQAAYFKLMLLAIGIVALLALRWCQNRQADTKSQKTSTAKSNPQTQNTRGSTVKKLPADIPEKAFKTLEYAQQNDGATRKGYKGNVRFSNRENKLPRASAPFKEYDINRWVKGKNRGPQRIVIGADGKAWYSHDHYKTFQALN